MRISKKDLLNMSEIIDYGPVIMELDECPYLRNGMKINKKTFVRLVKMGLLTPESQLYDGAPAQCFVVDQSKIQPKKMLNFSPKQIATEILNNFGISPARWGFVDRNRKIEILVAGQKKTVSVPKIGNRLNYPGIEKEIKSLNL